MYKREITGPWKISPTPNQLYNQAIVIPCYGESNYIFDTLSSIDNNHQSVLQNTLVIIVINNAKN